jgi:hypothetical protein
MKKMSFTIKSVAIAVIATTIGLNSTNRPIASTIEPSLLLNEAQRELATMQSSHYQHHTDVDESKGVFNYDCSGFVDYVLQKVAPAAYAELPISKPSSQRPLAQDFYNLFARSTSKTSHWQQVTKVDRLQAGDIVAWLRPPESDSNNTGHVMIIASQPRINPDSPKGTLRERADEMLIPVIDSTSSPHANDTRRQGETGLGRGTIGAIFNAQGKAIAYRWRGGLSQQVQATDIAFGRLR